MKPTILFVYGTLQKGYWNHRLLEKPGVRFLGRATTITRASLYLSNSIPYLKLDHQKGGRVHGEVYEVPAEVMPDIDRLEGGYKRTPIRARCNGRSIKAELYEARHIYGDSKLIKPNGYRRHVPVPSNERTVRA